MWNSIYFEKDASGDWQKKNKSSLAALMVVILEPSVSISYDHLVKGRNNSGVCDLDLLDSIMQCSGAVYVFQ